MVQMYTKKSHKNLYVSTLNIQVTTRNIDSKYGYLSIVIPWLNFFWLLFSILRLKKRKISGQFLWETGIINKFTSYFKNPFKSVSNCLLSIHIRKLCKRRIDNVVEKWWKTSHCILHSWTPNFRRCQKWEKKYYPSTKCFFQNTDCVTHTELQSFFLFKSCPDDVFFQFLKNLYVW